jgi:hypothetical protein
VSQRGGGGPPAGNVTGLASVLRQKQADPRRPPRRPARCRLDDGRGVHHALPDKPGRREPAPEPRTACPGGSPCWIWSSPSSANPTASWPEP